MNKVLRENIVCTIHLTMKRNSAIAIRMEYGCKSLTISAKEFGKNEVKFVFVLHFAAKIEQKMRLNL